MFSTIFGMEKGTPAALNAHPTSIATNITADTSKLNPFIVILPTAMPRAMIRKRTK